MNDMTEIRCVDCPSTRIHARGLCLSCYQKRRQKRKPLPPTYKPVYSADEIKDPHIRWLFQEIVDQGVKIDNVCLRSGVGRDVLQRAKRSSSIALFNFKCVAEALGYEILMVAKEVKNGPITTD